MNGPTFEWLKILSSAAVRSDWAQAVFVPPHAETTCPFNNVLERTSCVVPPRGIIGSRQLETPGAIVPGTRFQPVKTRVNSLTSVCEYEASGIP